MNLRMRVGLCANGQARLPKARALAPAMAVDLRKLRRFIMRPGYHTIVAALSATGKVSPSRS